VIELRLRLRLRRERSNAAFDDGGDLSKLLDGYSEATSCLGGWNSFRPVVP
jgi:hypothetical protein